MTQKILDLYFGIHSGKTKFVKELHETYGTFIFESIHPDPNWTISEIEKRKKTLSDYQKDKLSILKQLKKQNTTLIVGDFGNDTNINQKIMNRMNGPNPTPYPFNLENIKKFYTDRVAIETLRNQNYICSITSAQDPIGIRLGAAHSLIIKEIKAMNCYDIMITISPGVYNYHTCVIRKLCLGINPSDEEYYKAAISYILDCHPGISQNILGKDRHNLYESHYFMIYAFINALLDSYPQPLRQVNELNITNIFVSQGFSDPLYTRIPRQQIRDFLKIFSIKKYGTLVYYEWLESQSIIY